MSNDHSEKWGCITFNPAEDDEDFVTKKLKIDRMRQKTLTQRERLLPLEHNPPLKRLQKVSPTKKRRTSQSVPVTPTPPRKLKSTATQTIGNMKNLEPIAINFPYGSIVSINGYNLDYGRFPRKVDAPLFYGIVEDPSDHDEHVEDLQGDELIVRFVVSGQYEWYDKNSPNVLLSNYKKSYLALCRRPPTITSEVDSLEDLVDNTRLFVQGRRGWEVRVFEDPCYGCGNPWCLYKQHRTELKEMINFLKGNRRMTMKQKRYRCYRDAVSIKWGALGHASRKRVGWCWETAVRVAFPDEVGNYTGYKVGHSETEKDGVILNHE